MQGFPKERAYLVEHVDEGLLLSRQVSRQLLQGCVAAAGAEQV
jgi:hypothetical protein